MNSCYVRLCSAGRKTDQGATQKERLFKRSKDIAHEIPRRIGKSVAVVKAESIVTMKGDMVADPSKISLLYGGV